MSLCPYGLDDSMRPGAEYWAESGQGEGRGQVEVVGPSSGKSGWGGVGGAPGCSGRSCSQE